MEIRDATDAKQKILFLSQKIKEKEKKRFPLRVFEIRIDFDV